MIYSDMHIPSKNMRLSNTEISKMINEQQQELYAAENDKLIKEQAEADRLREEYYTQMQNRLADRVSNVNNRINFLQNVKESLLTECIMKLYTESVQAPMTSRDKIIARNLVTKFVKENGYGTLISRFATKNFLLSEMARISQKYYDAILVETTSDSEVLGVGLLPPDKDPTRPSGTDPWEVKNWDVPKDIVDDFYKELTTVDTMDASKLIKDRVADAIQQFVDSNSVAKMEYQDIISQAQEKIAATKDDSVAEGYLAIAKRKINDMKINKSKSIFNVMVESLTKKILTDDSYKTRYIHENTVDMESVVDDTTLIYTMLEMVNTTGMVNVDEEFIRSYLESLN